MKTKQLLERLLRIVGDSQDYFVSGSLSFLPLQPPYRPSGDDMDASFSVKLFHERRDSIVNERCVHVLRFDEVAVAQDSPLAGFLAPRTALAQVPSTFVSTVFVLLIARTCSRDCRSWHNNAVQRTAAGCAVELNKPRAEPRPRRHGPLTAFTAYSR